MAFLTSDQKKISMKQVERGEKCSKKSEEAESYKSTLSKTAELLT